MKFHNDGLDKNFQAIERIIAERNRLRKALEEAYNRMCNNQPLAVGFILEDALKVIKEEVETQQGQ